MEEITFSKETIPGFSLSPSRWFVADMREATSSRVSVTLEVVGDRNHTESLLGISVVSFVVGDLKGKQPDVWMQAIHPISVSALYLVLKLLC